MEGHCCTHLKGNDTADKMPCANHAFKKWTFLGEFGSKNDQSFCNVHNVMIQEKLHIPGGEEKAFLVPQESWWELPW
jgi:hypothetical protein